ncbi:MAG: hypothetical protein NZ988_02995 [Thaumarchaeota archaeon]|nr:hypothetical protein [Candidatus Calditenuaceae archaeon]MDW8186998.1 hypothetical protein [Nitrososphaerota archaeon]
MEREMRWRETVAFCAALVLLLTAFNSSAGGIDRNFGLSLASKVTFKVHFVEEGGSPRPVEEALVVLGLNGGRTDGGGTYEFIVTPGRYSSYVKLSDVRFSVVVLDLRVERDMTVELTFEVRKLRLEEIALTVGGDGVKLKASIAVPEATFAFASTPSIQGYLSDGTRVRLASYQGDYGYFGYSLNPGEVQSIDVEIETSLATVVPSGSYVPVQLVNVRVY